MLHSKLPHVGTTIFTTMSALAAKHHAINLAQGFPNFPIDEQLQSCLIETASTGAHQYAPMAGLPDLREKICSLVKKQYNRSVQPEQVLITAGATQAIFTAIQALVHVGEQVIVLDPSYDCYEAPIQLSGAHPVRIPLDHNFKPDWSRIAEAITPKTRMLIINNPHNPSGTIWDAQDYLALEALMQAHPQLILLSDEVYEYITFEDAFKSINEYPTICERAIIVSSFGKTFHITGWKVGYLICSDDLMLEIHKVHQFLVFSVNSIAQHALSAYLNRVDVNLLGSFYQEKRDLFRAGLANSRFNLLPAQGSYFQVASFEDIAALSDTQFCEELTIKHGVAAIPLSVFNANGEDRKLIRFCYAKTTETLQAATERLCKI